MKLSDFNKAADYYTGKASEIVRQLMLAGIGIIWLFNSTLGQNIVIKGSLIPALFSFSLAALFDLSQYVIGGFLWTAYYLKKEKENNEIRKNNGDQPIDPPMQGPKKIGRTIEFFYWAKVLLTAFAYVWIIIYLFKNLNFN